MSDLAKTKGTALVALVKTLRGQRERARGLLAPELHHYLDDDVRVHASSWYPEADLLAMIRAVLELIPGSRDAILEHMGVFLAREHLEGVYARLRSIDANTLVRRSLALWSSQHDTGSFEVEIEAPGRARFCIRDYALPSREMCAILTSYFGEWLRVSGWSGVTVRKQSCALEGADACNWLVVWDDAS